MEGRVSATGLKSVELDELTTSQIIINNEGLQYYHNFNILLPTISQGYYNLQEELDNIMISNTTQDVDLVQHEGRIGASESAISTLAATLTLTSAGTLTALDLVNQKNWIIFWHAPFNYNVITNHVYFNHDTKYFKIDASDNLTLVDTFWADASNNLLFNNYWKKDVSNNIYFNTGKVGIGLTNPNYPLEVGGNLNLNAGELYRSGVPLSSTLSLFLPLTGGTLTGALTGTTISATNLSGSGAAITNINASNVSSGTLPISRGGTGASTFTANQILIGNGTTSILQSSNLSWDVNNNTLAATNFIGSGALITNINAANISSGTLPISRGGIGTTTLSSNQILIGNGTSILQSANLSWNNTSNTLSTTNVTVTKLGVGVPISATYPLEVGGNLNLNAGELYRSGVSLSSTLSNFLPLAGGTLSGTLTGTTISATNLTATNLTGSGAAITNINASNISSGTLAISRGGTGASTFTSNQILIGNGTTSILQSSNLSWNNTTNTLSSTNILMSGQITGVTTLNGTTGIFGTVSTTNNSNIGVPSTGIYGGLGDKLIFTLGGIIEHPYSIGRYTNELWYSIPSTASHKFYCGGLNRFSIDSLGNVTASGNLNGTTGIFGQLYTTNNTNVALPAPGVAGGTGDKIIFTSGTLSTYPYSIGRNTNELWFSSPSGASFKFYTGGTNTLTLNSTGNLTTNGSITNGSGSYLYAGGLRIAGWDYGNTIYSENNDIGITLKYASIPNGSINLGFFGGNGNILTVKNAEINFNQRVKFPNGVWNISADGIYRTYYAANSTSYYCCGGSGTTQAHTFFNSSYANIMTILNNGNVGIGVGNPNCRLYINTNAGNSVNSFALRVASGGGTDNSGYSTLIGLGTEANGWSKCAIGHARVSAYDTGDIVFLNRNTWDISDCNMGDEVMRITRFGNVGINNSLPMNIGSGIYSLCIGHAGIQNREGCICIGRNTGMGATRQYRMGYTSDYSWCIGDFGGNNSVGSWIQQFYCAYSAPVASLFITAAGYVNMQYGYGNGSDERIKTNIKTIENALDKTLLLRGVEFNLILEQEKKRIGLIAQEVELIMPEVVHTDENTTLKSIEYQNLVGLLIEAIKDQQKQINELKNILIKNNLY